MTGTPAVEIVSFGFLHGTAPDAHLLVDLREHFRDPHLSPAMRELTGEDAEVVAAVLGTEGIPALIDAYAAAVKAFTAGPSSAGRMTVVAAGCAGGRHRAHVFSTQLARRLTADGFTVRLTHRDIHRAVVDRDTAGRAR